MRRPPSQLCALAALYEAAAIKNRRFVDDLHGMGRREEAAIWERRTEAQERRASDLREQAAELGAVRELMGVVV